MLSLILSGSTAWANATFSTPGTWSWVCPVGVTTVQVECWGGGGTGGSSRRPGGSNGYGGGGGGGAYAKSNSVTVVPGTAYTVFVGAGGVHTTATIAATGGFGAAGTNSWFGDGVTTTNCLAVGGGGGGDGYGNSAAGGGGGGAFSSGSQQNGGDGAAGQVVITYTMPAPSAYLIQTAGSSSVTTTASSNVNLTITAINASGTQLIGFYQDITLNFYGLASSPSNNVPKVTDKSGTSQTVNSTASTPNATITFTNGIATVNGSANGVLKAYNSAAVVLNCTDGTASSATGTGAAGLSLTVSPAAAARLVFSTAAQNIPVSTVSGVMTVQRKDAFGNPNPTDADVTVNLTTTASATGTFLDSVTGNPITSVTIPNGSSSANFKYQDTAPGTPTLTVSDNAAVLASASQLETVSSLNWAASPANYNWDTTSVNWTGGTGIYSDGQGVTFDDTGSTTSPINLVGTLSPASVAIITSSKNYTLGGTGKISGSGSLSKSGSTTLTIATANDFSGSTTVYGGVVDAQNNTALGGGATTVNSGAAVQVDGSGLSISEAITLNGTGISSGGALRNLANANTVSSTITLASNARINSDAGTLSLTGGSISGATNVTVGGSGNVTIGDAITTTGTLTKDGSGTLTLSGNNTYPGNTTVSAGTMSISSPANVVSPSIVLNGGDLFASSSVTLTNKLGIGPTSGTVGTNALVDVTSGQTLEIDGIIASAGNSGTDNLTINSGLGNNGALVLNGVNTFGGTTIISNGTVNLLNPLALQNSTLNYSSGTLTVDSSITTATLGGLTGTQNIGLTNAANTALALNVGNNSSSTTYGGNLNGSGSLTKIGTGTLFLTGSNNFSGNTTITAASGGGVELDTGAWLKCAAIFAQTNTTLTINGASVTASGSSVIGSTGGGSGSKLLVYGGSATFPSLTCQNQDGQLVTVTNGTLSANSLTINRSAAFNTAPTATTPIAGATTTGLYVNGAAAGAYLGSLSIGINNSSASARLDAGTLVVTNQVAVSKISGGSARWSILQVNGGNFTALDTANGIVVAQNNGVACNGEFYISGGVATVGKVAFGAASDTAGGNGFLILNNASLYVGSGGIVQPNTAGFASTVSLNGGTLGAYADWSSALPMQLNGTSVTIKTADITDVAHTITLSGNLSGGSSLTKTGNGTLVLGGTDTYNGPTTNAAGTLLVTNSLTSDLIVNGGTLGGNGTIAGNATLNSGAILNAGFGNVGILNFGGTLTLSATSTNLFAVTTAGGVSNSVSVTGTLTPNSSVIKITSGTALGVGTYTLFSHSGSVSGSFNATPVFDVTPAATASIVDTGSQIQLVIGTPGPSGPASITNSISGSTLSLTWPAGQGWRLVSQTNSLSTGLTTSWNTVPGVSDGSATITVDPTQPTVFYELVYP